MLYIETYLAPSTIHGIGVFTKQAIKKWEMIAKRNSEIDQGFSLDQYESFLEEEKNQIKKYARKDKKTWEIKLNADDTRFLNHSSTPNIWHREDELFALSDIQENEELTDNYTEIDEDFSTSFIS